MEIRDLKRKITDAGGTLGFQGIKFEYVDGSDIDVHYNLKLIAWVGKHDVAESDNVIDKMSISSDDVLKNIDGFISLAQFLGLTIKDIKPIEVEKVITNPTHVKVIETLQTQKQIVEAQLDVYEKIFSRPKITLE